MLFSFIYLLLAILGLSFLIFIHELGHYIMARRVGMRVETFSIGFGSPIFSWMHDGVRWQVGWLLFGGYVKIAGTEGETDEQIYNTPGGFFNKSPKDRIKVAVMGPLANLVVGFLIFVIIWASGGRQENFSEYTSKIGWVDPHSELYALGVRPGDEVTAYDDHPFESAKDHLYAPMTDPEGVAVKGFKINYSTMEKTPFDYTVKPYPRPNSPDKEILTSGILKSANYVIHTKMPDHAEAIFMEASPLKNSGLQYDDRVFWVNGEQIFSLAQLNNIINNGRVLLTVQRGDHHFLALAPRVLVQEFKLEPDFREELVDWQYEAQLNGVKIQQLHTIPYNMTNDGEITGRLKFLDKDKENEAFQQHPFSGLEAPLQTGDKILAVDGTPINHSYQILYQLQKHRLLVIVQRDPELLKQISWSDADATFDREEDPDALQKLVQSIGTSKPLTQAGNFHLLEPVTPITLGDWIAAIEKENALNTELNIPKLQAESKEAASQLMLGLPGIQDRKVQYNPGPVTQFWQVNEQIGRTLGALLSGSLNMRFMSGPVGIVQMVQEQWKLGFTDALYWLGLISINLGILNLLPIPVLDGGTILFCLLEIGIRRRLHPKVLEKAIIPFAALLICFFIYITYYDLKRLFGGFFS